MQMPQSTQPVTGVSERGSPTQLTATTSCLKIPSPIRSSRRIKPCRPLNKAKQSFVQEQSKIGALLGVVELPKPQRPTFWIVDHPALGITSLQQHEFFTQPTFTANRLQILG